MAESKELTVMVAITVKVPVRDTHGVVVKGITLALEHWFGDRVLSVIDTDYA